MIDETQQKAIFVDEKTQKELNRPLPVQGFDPKDREFLELLVGLVNQGKIKLLEPDSLINKAVYEKLSVPQQGKANIEAVNLLADIREIKDLHDAGYSESYQMQYMVQRLRLTKERLEDVGGDLFII